MRVLRFPFASILLALAIGGQAAARDPAPSPAARATRDDASPVQSEIQRHAAGSQASSPTGILAPSASLAIPVGSVMVGAQYTTGSPTSAYRREIAEDGRVDLSFGSFAPYAGGSGGAGLVLPLAGARISSLFGYRIHPITGRIAFHSGIDLAAPEGTPVVAAQAGRVVFADFDGGYGLAIRIAGAGGISTLYGHLSRFAVHEGAVVRAGETIGFVGSTGFSTGAHLHFEVRRDGRPVDPAR